MSPLLFVIRMCYADLVANRLIERRNFAMRSIFQYGFLRLSALLCVFCVALFGFMPMAHASMVFCNHTRAALDVAFGYHENKGWISEGWWRIEPSQCARVYKKKLTERFYFYYVATPDAVERKAQTLTKGVYRFCVAPKAFHAKGNSNCAEQGMEDRGFESLDVGAGTRNFTFNFKN